jgi:predicted AAA+ superfamily ATPase
MILERELKKAVISSLARYPVVGLIRCRQVGKTTLAKQARALKLIYWSLTGKIDQ